MPSRVILRTLGGLIIGLTWAGQGLAQELPAPIPSLPSTIPAPPMPPPVAPTSPVPSAHGEAKDGPVTGPTAARGEGKSDPDAPPVPLSMQAPIVPTSPQAPGVPAPAPVVITPGVASPCANGDEPVPDIPNTFQQGNYRFRFSGQYRVLPNVSNFDFQPETIGNGSEQRAETFAQQRLRLGLDVFTSEHVSAYIQLQIGGFVWGQNYEFPKTFVGPTFPAADDRVGIMLRRGWLQYSDDECGKVRVGILDWHDSFGDTLASSDYDFDVAGIDWTKTYKDLGDLKVTLGAFVLTDEALIESDKGPLGNHDALLFTFDADKPVAEKTSIGASVYYLADDGEYSYPTLTPYKSAWDIWVGVRAKTEVDCVPLNAFVIYNGGQRDNLDGEPFFRHQGWAGKAEVGGVPFGPGKWYAQVLASTGDGNPGENPDSGEFRTIAQTYRDNFGAQGYWGYLYIAAPNGPSDVKDLGVSLQDRGLGLFTAQTKYVYPLCDKLTATEAAGWLTATKPNPIGGGKQIGTELAHQFTYDFGGGLKLDVGAAVLFTGDFYRATLLSPKPVDLWMGFSRLQLEF